MATTVTIPHRYQGPPDTANGGYVAGLLAVGFGPSATVRLERAAPLDVPLRLEDHDDEVSLWDGDQRLAVAVPHDGLPKPAPGVPTMPVSRNSKSKKAHELMPSGSFTQT